MLTLDLGVKYSIATAGLVPGYDKTDAVTGFDRFYQNRRILRSGGSSTTDRA